MKLYATITSERATKGQGGEYLDIEVFDDLKKTFATIEIREKPTGTGHEVEIWYNGYNTTINCYNDRSPSGWTDQPKAKKPATCKYCDGLKSENGTMQCYAEHDNYIKAKKQKGEDFDPDKCSKCGILLPDLDHVGGCPES